MCCRPSSVTLVSRKYRRRRFFMAARLAMALFPEVGQAAEGRKTCIGDVEIRQEMQRKLKPLQVRHAGEHLQLGVSLQLAACAGRERRPWEIQFADVRQTGEML